MMEESLTDPNGHRLRRNVWKDGLWVAWHPETMQSLGCHVCLSLSRSPSLPPLYIYIYTYACVRF